MFNSQSRPIYSVFEFYYYNENIAIFCFLSQPHKYEDKEKNIRV